MSSPPSTSSPSFPPPSIDLSLNELFLFSLSTEESSSQITLLLTCVLRSLRGPPRVLKLTPPSPPSLLSSINPSSSFPPARSSRRTSLWSLHHHSSSYSQPTLWIRIPVRHQRFSGDPTQRGKPLPHRRSRLVRHPCSPLPYSKIRRHSRRGRRTQ